MSRRTALILGAGWSAAAGLPLAADLVQGPIYVASRGAEARVNAVLAAWERWLIRHPEGTAEPFLAEVEAGKVRTAENWDVAELAFPAPPDSPLPWAWAVEAVALRLAYPVLVPRDDPRRLRATRFPGHPNTLRYGGNLALSPNAPALERFLRAQLAASNVVAVVTTNYDTLAERLLRPYRMKNKPEPGFIYGGLPEPQYAHGHLPWDSMDPQFVGQLGELSVCGAVPVFKLHGSLNWSRAGDAVSIFRDQRSAFRHGGTAAIVAPTPEKATPHWLRPVWDGAYEALRSADRWVVVGYSLPDYDHAAREFFASASSTGTTRTVEVHDPYGANVSSRWSDVCGITARAMPGI